MSEEHKFTKDELLYLKDAAQHYDDPKFPEDLQEAVFIKILYMIDAADPAEK